MKYLITTLLLLLATTAFAATTSYDLKMQISLDGKLISTPEIITHTGVATTFSSGTGTDDISIEVLATETSVNDKKGILLNFVFKTTVKGGQKTSTTSRKAEVLVTEGKPTTFTVGDAKSGKEELSLTVVAKKVNL